jgi:hypothetical protein
LTQTQIQGLDLIQIQSLTQTQIQAFRSFQIKLFKPAQIKLFKNIQFSWFSDKQIPFFISSQIKSFSKEQVISVAQKKCFSRNQQYDLYSSDLYNANTAEIRDFENFVKNPDKTNSKDYYYRLLKATNYTTLTWLLDSDVIPKLSTTYLGYILKNIPNDKIQFITETQIQSLTNEQIQSLTNEQIQNLTEIQISFFLAKYFVYFPRGSLLPTQLSKMTLEQKNEYNKTP